MKVVLLVLSGDPDAASTLLSQQMPAAEIQLLTRGEIDSAGLRQRLKTVRAQKPDVFAVFTERLVWQRGQNAFLAFGASSGARKTILFDRHRGWHEETRARTSAATPFRLTSEAARTIGAHPVACTLTIRGRRLSIQPIVSISANAFHMPTRPVPPPVG